jgi:hypothetical protein
MVFLSQGEVLVLTNVRRKQMPENITRQDQILGGASLLLVVSLLFFPWFSISVGPFTATLNGIDSPDGWLGWLAMLAALAVLVDLAVERFSPQTQLPALGGSREATRFFLAVGAAGFVVLKFLFHLGHTGDLGWGFFVAAISAAALVYFALQANGGSISLPSMPKGGSSAPPVA